MAVGKETTPTNIIPTATLEPLIPKGFVEYSTQSGDTLPAVAAHFGVEVADIVSESALDPSLLIDPGVRLLVPDVLEETTSPDQIFPDAEVVFSPSAVDFDVEEFAKAQGGHLSVYTEQIERGTRPAPEIVAHLALEHSINPRILLALMEVESGWVSGEPDDNEQAVYPFGYIQKDTSGLLRQTGWAIRQLTKGYYGWRAGTLNELQFSDGSTLRLAPSLNAGTVAVLYFFAQANTREEWEQLVYGEEGIFNTYETLFGDPWEQAAGAEPLFPAGTTQPELNLPFQLNKKWNYTCGPHTAWGKEGPPAALDFAPPLDGPGCGTSTHWITAAAPGRVVRVGNGVVVLDLDQDGFEQTGWVLVYMHVATSGRVDLNADLDIDEVIGHPSCEGGSASGVHVHIARKYNGEWVLADGGLPFILSGYQAANGEGVCEGTLENADRIVYASQWGSYLTVIYRPESKPKYLYTPTPQP